MVVPHFNCYYILYHIQIALSSILVIFCKTKKTATINISDSCKYLYVSFYLSHFIGVSRNSSILFGDSFFDFIK